MLRANPRVRSGSSRRADSAAALFVKFEEYRDADDLVGADMARKFIQMRRRSAGLTDSRRWASLALAAMPTTRAAGSTPRRPMRAARRSSCRAARRTRSRPSRCVQRASRQLIWQARIFNDVLARVKAVRHCTERSLIAQDERYLELVERHRELEWATHDAQADAGGDLKPKASTSRRSEPFEDEESDEDVKPARSRRSVKDEDDYVP